MIWRPDAVGPRPWRQLAWLPVFLFAAVVCWLAVYPHMFAGRAFYDDEGTLLTTLAAYSGGAVLYDAWRSVYGPFYYVFWDGLLSLAGLPVSHDSGRLATTAAWVVSALALGLAVWRASGRVTAGLLTQLAVCLALATLSNEPMHPVGLIALLLTALALLAAARRWPGRLLAAGSGALVGALVLVKINVGLLALAAFGLSAFAVCPVLSARRALRRIVEAAFLATPFLLMAGNAHEAWVQRYALHSGLAALALLLALRSPALPTAPAPLPWRAFATGFLLCTGLTVLLMLAQGSSLAAMLDCLLLGALNFSVSFDLPLYTRDWPFMVDAAGLAGVLLMLWASRRGALPDSGPAPWLLAFARLAAGLALLFGAAALDFPFREADLMHRGSRIALAGLLWLVLPLGPGEAGSTAAAWLRRLLPALALMQTLHAYPVAGSQIALASLLMVAAGVLCLSDGAAWFRGRMAWLRPALALALLIWTGRELWQYHQQGVQRLQAGVPLGLPGASKVRLPAGEAHTLRTVVDALNSHCEAFVMLPGLGSFYFWTEQQPPTRFAAGPWHLYSVEGRRGALQREDVRRLSAQEGLCLVYNPRIEKFWRGDRQPVDGPLSEFLSRGFEPLMQVEDYQLLRRSTAG